MKVKVCKDCKPKGALYQKEEIKNMFSDDKYKVIIDYKGIYIWNVLAKHYIFGENKEKIAFVSIKDKFIQVYDKDYFTKLKSFGEKYDYDTIYKCWKGARIKK